MNEPITNETSEQLISSRHEPITDDTSNNETSEQPSQYELLTN